MQITSPDFGYHENIPDKYTCQGANISPELDINAVPNAAESLALVMNDPDAPGGLFDHWIVYDIPASTTVIEQGASPGTAGINDFGQTGYSGPCPPYGSHRYVFTLYALDRRLGLPGGLDRERLLDAIAGHVLLEAELVGRYAKA